MTEFTGVKKISDQDYDELPALRSTLLKDFIRSPAHYKYAMSPEARAENDGKTHFLIGNLVHSGLLEPETVPQKYKICDESTRNTKGYKELKEKFPSHKIVMRKEADQAEAICKAVYALDPVMDLIRRGEKELAAANYLKTGIGDDKVYCKAKLDLYIKEDKHIIDLKTTAESALDFRYRIQSYGYDVSAAFYIDVMAACGYDVDKFTFIVVEKSPPYGVMMYYLSPEDYERGQQKYLKALPHYLQCLRTGSFPSYSLTPQPTFLKRED